MERFQRKDESGAARIGRAFDVLERRLPARLAPLVRRLRAPSSRLWRIPLGIACVAASALWFLPVIGIEFLPLGLLLLAQDIPVLRRPVAGAVLWLALQALRLLRRWRSPVRPERRPTRARPRR